MMNVMSSDVLPMCLSILAGVGMAYAVTKNSKHRADRPECRQFLSITKVLHSHVTSFQ